MAQHAAAIRWIHQLTRHTQDASATDQELLQRFLSAADATALELLIRRHERMVMSVCLRLLHDTHDAEDAFQATFLALVRKAQALRNGQAVASWLYRIAYRVALTILSQRRQRATQLIPLSPTMADSFLVAADTATEFCELRELLDHAVNRLPEAQRSVVVLCYFEGKTHEEAARLVGCQPGTIASRLARAREKMRAWLARRGQMLPLTTVAVALGEAGARAAGANGLVMTTAGAITALVKGGKLPGPLSPVVVALSDSVLTALAWGKVKTMSAILVLLTVLALGVGGRWTSQPGTSGVHLRTAAGDPQEEQKPDATREQASALVKQLGSRKFADRQAAQQALLKMGPEIAPLLDQWLKGADLETRRRLEQIRYQLVGHVEDILRFLESQSPVYEDRRVDVPETIRGIVADHQPGSGDLLLAIAGDSRHKLNWPAVNLFGQTWESHSGAQLETHLRKQLRLKTAYRPRYPAGIAAMIELGYHLHYAGGSWPRSMTWRTQTSHYLDGRLYGKPYRRSGADAGVTTGWIQTGKLAEGKHVFGLVVAYEFMHRGKQHQGKVVSQDWAFEVVPASTRDELLARPDAETDRLVKRHLTILEHEPTSGAGPFQGGPQRPDPWQPQITWKTPAGKDAGLHIPVWQVAEPLPVDLCFEVVFEDLATGQRFQGDPLLLPKGKTCHRGYLTLRDVRGFTGKRTGFANVRIHLLPSRALALTEPAITCYYPGTISVERRVKCVGSDEAAPDAGREGK